MVYQQYDREHVDMTAHQQSHGMWRKSSYSGNEDDYCVEVTDFSQVVGVRDSKDRGRPALSFLSASWSQFVTAVKAGGGVG